MGFEPPIVALNLAHSDIVRLPENLKIVDADFDWAHFEVADGNFVPRLTYGAPMLMLARRFSRAVFDVLLLSAKPERQVVPLREAGADVITVCPETTTAPRELLQAIRATGARAGIALCPGTGFESVRRYLPAVDVVTVMTAGVEQESHEFVPELLARVRDAREMRERDRLGYLIQVSGGLTLSTVASVREAGADVYVVGRAVFATPDPSYTLATFRAAVRGEPLAGSPDGVTHPEPARPVTRIFKTRRPA